MHTVAVGCMVRHHVGPSATSPDLRAAQSDALSLVQRLLALALCATQLDAHIRGPLHSLQTLCATRSHSRRQGIEVRSTSHPAATDRTASRASSVQEAGRAAAP